MPTQKIEYLGFTMNSTDMTVTLTKEKQEKLSVLVKQIVTSKRAKIRDFRKLRLPYLVLNMEDYICFSFNSLKTLLYVNV